MTALNTPAPAALIAVYWSSMEH